MHIAISFFLVLVATVATYADPQYLYALPQPYPYDAAYPVEPNYFRANLPSSIENIKPEDRLFFGTATLTLATTTSTSTSTTTTTCTTSSAALATCIAGGRRRRFEKLGKGSRGLLFDGQNDEEEPSIFVRGPEPEVAAVQPEDNAVERVERSSLTMIPFIIQPGFSAPENVRGGRFLVAFGTSTVTTTTVSTYTAILTATCNSSSDFLTCGSNGK